MKMIMMMIMELTMAMKMMMLTILDGAMVITHDGMQRLFHPIEWLISMPAIESADRNAQQKNPCSGDGTPSSLPWAWKLKTADGIRGRCGAAAPASHTHTH